MKDIVDALEGNEFPDGWNKFKTVYQYLQNRLFPCEIVSVGIEKGLLRVKAICDNPEDQEIFDRVAQSLARDSATTCMKCGQYGFRRKAEQHWPALCGVHYVEYVNYLDENQ